MIKFAWIISWFIFSERLVASLVESIYATKFFQQSSAAHIKQQVQISDKAAEVIESRQKQQKTV